MTEEHHAAGPLPLMRAPSGRRGRFTFALTIRGKIFAAFLAVAGIIGLLGVYAVGGMSEAGRMVVRTFDMPLMAISHAREAKAGFTELQFLTWRRALSVDAREQAELDAAILLQAKDLQEDLDIAARRSLSPEGKAAAAEIKSMVAAWQAVVRTRQSAGTGAPSATEEQIERRFTALINVAAGDAFRWRQQALATIDWNRLLQAAGTGAALLLAIVITLLLARQILRPLKAASQAASRIAGGELETPIPRASRDETGALLAAMTVMQDNLRDMMAREIAARRSAQQRTIDAIESSREGVVLVDAEGLIAVANSEAARMFPAAAAALVPGRPFADFLHQAGAAALGDALTHDDSEIQLPDGRWIRVARNAARGGGYVLIWSDISLLKEREISLRAAKDQAEAANTAKTHFLANMSHELRTPLNAIIGFSEIISHEMFGPVGVPKYKGYATDIVGSGRHLLAIINDILDIAKSQAGTLQIDPHTVTVDELFEGCTKIAAHGSERAGLSFAVEPAPGLAVFVDAVKTRQILLNLLSNAMKFTPAKGSIVLRAEAGDADFVDLVVEDTGIGMREGDIPVALSPFGQVDSRLARKYEGTGLGLPLAKALAELQRGTLTLSSAPGAGTTVRVRLPRRAATELPAPAEGGNVLAFRTPRAA